MSEPKSTRRESSATRPHPGNAKLCRGLFLLILAALAIYLARGLPQGSLRSMGPAMLPDWLAYGVGACGLILVLLSFLKDGDALEKSALRGPAVVLVAILAFALTIRPFSFGPLTASRPWHGGGGAARDPHRRLRDRGRKAPADFSFWRSV